MRAEEVRPTRTTAEIVIRVGDQASILLDHDEKDDGPPCLCIHEGTVQVLLYPLGWAELGHVTEADLQRAAELVIDMTRWRDAIYRKLAKQRTDKAARLDQVAS